MDEKPQNKLRHIAAFLADPFVSSLILIHPNRVPEPTFVRPPQWQVWWDSSQEESPLNWLSLLKYSGKPPRDDSKTFAAIPPSLRWAIDTAHRLQIPRDPATLRSVTSATASLDLGSRFLISYAAIGECVASSPDVPEQSSIPPDSPKKSSGAYGMSPKKHHEVTQMINYISDLVSSTPTLSNLRHVVDVGSGQGYLSRALRDTLHFHVLAIDGDDHQTQGAERRAEKIKKRSKKGKAKADRVSDPLSSGQKGSLTHKTIHINPLTLRSAVEEWISEVPEAHNFEHPVPVLIVALHACGSLTPDILRCFLAQYRTVPGEWKPAGGVIVGCCYNLMSENDFPASSCLATSPQDPRIKLYRSHTYIPCDCDPPPYSDHSSRPCSIHKLVLTEHHVQLAAQVPSEWTRTNENLRSAELAMNKVVWRALLGRWVGLMEGKQGDSTRRRLVGSVAGEKPRLCEDTGDEALRLKHPLQSTSLEPRLQVRLGKLNNSVYSEWPTFLRAASEKTGISFPEEAFLDSESVERKILQRRLEVLYVMRCLLGPVVESLILLDRMLWIDEELREGPGGMEVKLVNLFDQAQGSGRNVAIILAPRNESAVN